MKNLLKIALSIGFCLMFCCLSIGYASLNDQLYVSGSVSYHYVPEETEPPTEPPPSGPSVGSDGANGKIELRANESVFSDGKTTTADIVLTQSTNTQYIYTITFNVTKSEKKVDIDTYLHITIGGKLYSLQLNDDNQVEMDSGSSDSFKKFISDWNATPGTYSVTMTLTKSQLDSTHSGETVGSWSGPYAVTSSSASYSLDTSNVRNLSISSTEQATFDLDSRPNLLLTLTPDEGYLLPECFTVTIGETIYEINTNGENELETMFFDAESSTLHILGDLLPTDGSAVFVAAYAVPETPPYTLQFNLENLTENHYTADGGLYIRLTPDEEYLLPESFAVTIGDMAHTVYTTAEDAAGEGEPSVKDNPAGMGFDVLESKLYISGVLLPTDGSPVIISACAELPEEEPTEELTEEPTEAPTEDATEPSATEQPAEDPTTEPSQNME